MNKRFDIQTILIVILCVIVILAFAVMMANAVRATAADTEAQEIMEQAKERIDLYYASRPAQERPTATVVVFEAPAPSETPEPVEDWYIESIPLDKPLQKSLFDAACEFGVDYFLALGVIAVESNFQNIVGDNGKSIGYFQIQEQWWRELLEDIGVTDLSDPEQNFRSGCAILAQLTEQYKGDVPAALTAYNAGKDTGSRQYANAVLRAADEIMDAAGVVTK